jgi:hypothetical protein
MKKIVQTPCGPVRGKVLAKLERSFDTHWLLEALCTLDDIHRGLCVGPGPHSGQDYQELSKLHTMAHVVIDGWTILPPPDEDRPIWELAADVSSTIDDWARRLRRLRRHLDALAALEPLGDGPLDRVVPPSKAEERDGRPREGGL